MIWNGEKSKEGKTLLLKNISNILVKVMVPIYIICLRNHIYLAILGRKQFLAVHSIFIFNSQALEPTQRSSSR